MAIIAGMAYCIKSFPIFSVPTWQFKLFSNKEELLHFHKGIFRLKKKIVVDSLAIGMAPFLMNLAACYTQPFGRNAYQFFVCRKNRDC